MTDEGPSWLPKTGRDIKDLGAQLPPGTIGTILIALIQRVSEAAVTVDERIVGEIGRGILALIGIERGDRRDALRAPARARADLSDLRGRRRAHESFLADIGGGLLLVPQFTLAADTQKGTRPGFSTAEPPDSARTMFAQLSDAARRPATPRSRRANSAPTCRVSLVNDGPVTFWLRMAPDDEELTVLPGP